MKQNIRLFTKNQLFPEHLYKGMFLLDDPRVAYMGMHKLSYGFPGLDIQAWYLRDVLLGRVSLEIDVEERAKDVAQWIDRGNSVKSIYEAALFMSKYLKDLVLAIVDYPAVNLDATAKMLEFLFDEKREKILDYRDSTYASPYTYTMAAENEIPWIESDKDE